MHESMGFLSQSRRVILNLPNAVTLQYSFSCCDDPHTIKLFLLLLL